MHLFLPLKLQLLAPVLTPGHVLGGSPQCPPPGCRRWAGVGGSHPAPSSSALLPYGAAPGARSWVGPERLPLCRRKSLSFQRAASHAELQQVLVVCSVHRAVLKELGVNFPHAQRWHSRCRSLLMGLSWHPRADPHSLHFPVAFYELWATFLGLHWAHPALQSMQWCIPQQCWKYP